LSQPREFQKVSIQENPEGSLKPALFMKVRCESVQTRSETGLGAVKSGGILVQYVEGLNGETARHSRVSALAAEAS